jgi:phosphopentomutase
VRGCTSLYPESLHNNVDAVHSATLGRFMNKRVFIIVLDGVGCGELPDAGDYGDKGSDTLGNLSRAISCGLRLPTLKKLGLGNIHKIKGVPATQSPLASWGRMLELSKGKDTIAGHWEMMGVVTEHPFPTYPGGFPQKLIKSFEKRINRKILANCAASGTEIIKKLGDEHMRTGSPIIYTSADSVFQIAAHEDIISTEELYDICHIARYMLVPPHNVCRVIARPFVGPPYQRTSGRRDFPLAPHGTTILDILNARGIPVESVGKVIDMFDGNGFSGSTKTTGNTHGMKVINTHANDFKHGVVFANLVDFDSLYGHRNDTAGFYSALRAFDKWLKDFLPTLKKDDYLIITADHGLDPTTASTDHSREYVPVLLYGQKVMPQTLGTRDGFYDIAATIGRIFSIDNYHGGKSLI